MPTTYERCDKSVEKLAQEILHEFGTHLPLLNADVHVDFVFGYAEDPARDCALKWGGVKALGICKKIGLKERALGRGDAEIALDGDWWKNAKADERRALLDHELHHIQVIEDIRGIVRDDLNRPKLNIRKHDYQFGWFNLIAERHGIHSMERQQATMLMLASGQYYWPDLAGKPMTFGKDATIYTIKK